LAPDVKVVLQPILIEHSDLMLMSLRVHSADMLAEPGRDARSGWPKRPVIEFMILTN
jgi:hypothetical protein